PDGGRLFTCDMVYCHSRGQTSKERNVCVVKLFVANQDTSLLVGIALLNGASGMVFSHDETMAIVLDGGAHLFRKHNVLYTEPVITMISLTALTAGLTLEEITRILEEDDQDVSAIYIEPPEATIYSDEDSADEDSGGLIDNLSSRHLRAGAETVLADGRRIGGCDSDEDEGEDEQQVYQGKQKDTATSTQYEKVVGKAAAPLLEMADELPVDVRHLPFHFYFDNLFTSLHLLRHLKEKNYEATGTVRQNRVPKECPIARPDFIKRKTRGYEEHALSDDGIIILRWMDNSVVTIASTVHGVEPMSSADRYSRAQKKRIK
ncbi:uncharacterized protein LOC119378336, partial [Rhipicephalus sanguineus]|uniref:uncharacterized protein LOC119378336 n=1 Tax=Rhipicephalus sanguineus TaxID=34632 RepID=UPI0018950ADC